MYPLSARPDAGEQTGCARQIENSERQRAESFFVEISIVYSLPSIRYSESFPPISNFSRCSQFWNNCSYVTRR